MIEFVKLYHWKVLPQGWLIVSPYERKTFVSASIQEARTLNLSVYIIHGVLLQALIQWALKILE